MRHDHNKITGMTSYLGLYVPLDNFHSYGNVAITSEVFQSVPLMAIKK